MRHINFDESSVLTEFAKIAHEQGFIKEAQEPALPRGEVGSGVGESRTIKPITTGPEPTTSAPAKYKKSLLSSYPSLNAIDEGNIKGLNPQKVWDEVNGFFPALMKALSRPELSAHYTDVAGPLIKKLELFFSKTLNKKIINEVIKRMQKYRSIGKGYFADDNAADSSAADAVIKQLSSVTGPTMTVAKQLAKEIEMYKRDPNAGAALSRRWKQQPWLGYVNQAFPQTQPAQQQSTADTVIKQLSAITGPTMPVAQQLAKEINMYKGDPNAAGTLRRRWKDEPWSKYVNQAFPQKSASVEEPMSKSAKDDGGKKYDVTGEEGKDLVDKAHPGGGTKTELTHSKTDENLVETIVEQQEKDIEVAKSVPKGTYAALIELAGRLDKLGLYAEADEIDDILRGLKKKVAAPATPYSAFAKKLKIDILAKLQALDVSPQQRVLKQKLLEEWGKSNMPTLTETVSRARDLTSRWQRALPGVADVFSQASGYTDEIKSEQAALRTTKQMSGGIAGDIGQELPLEPLPLKLEPIPKLTKIQKQRIYWKKLYNKMIGDIGEDVRKKYNITSIPVNGKKTKEFLRALNLVRDTKAKTLKQFIDIMNSKSESTTPIPPPAQVLPPKPQKTPGYEQIFSQLVKKYNDQFNAPEFRLGKNRTVSEYLRNVAKKLEGAAGLTPQALNNAMNRVIQNLNVEDIRAMRTEKRTDEGTKQNWLK